MLVAFCMTTPLPVLIRLTVMPPLLALLLLIAPVLIWPPSSALKLLTFVASATATLLASAEACPPLAADIWPGWGGSPFVTSVSSAAGEFAFMSPAAAGPTHRPRARIVERAKILVITVITIRSLVHGPKARAHLFNHSSSPRRGKRVTGGPKPTGEESTAYSSYSPSPPLPLKEPTAPMLTEFCVMLLKPVVIEMLLTPPVMLLFMSPTLPVMNWVTAPVTV